MTDEEAVRLIKLNHTDKIVAIARYPISACSVPSREMIQVVLLDAENLSHVSFFPTEESFQRFLEQYKEYERWLEKQERR